MNNMSGRFKTMRILLTGTGIDHLEYSLFGGWCIIIANRSFDLLLNPCLLGLQSPNCNFTIVGIDLNTYPLTVALGCCYQR
jgi:hypothetical protein